MKVKEIGISRINDVAKEGKYLIFSCPGCKVPHSVPLEPGSFEPPYDDMHFTFNGDFDRPTITPELSVQTDKHICQSTITEGKITYIGKTSHSLNGETVELPELK